VVVPSRHDKTVPTGAGKAGEDGGEKAVNIQKAYSLLEVKALSDEKREITGIATTPEPDRVGDIVDPMGVKFKNPLPLLWQHRHDSPVGSVKFGKPTKNGIPFSASLPKITEDGPLKQLIDMAWQSVKAELVRGVSIGFRPIEYSYIDGGGVRFTECEVYELSLVTIPCNAAATIQSIKAFDTGRRDLGYVRLLDIQKAKPANLNGAVRLIRP